MESNEKKLGLFPMAASILAGMIGSGVYDISYQLGCVASPGGAIVAWVVCFVGMLAFVLSLQNLLDKEPDGDGMYIYARKVAGPLGEFMSAWGYWVSGWIGNIAFATMMMIALGTFSRHLAKRVRAGLPLPWAQPSCGASSSLSIEG